MSGVGGLAADAGFGVPDRILQVVFSVFIFSRSGHDIYILDIYWLLLLRRVTIILNYVVVGADSLRGEKCARPHKPPSRRERLLSAACCRPRDNGFGPDGASARHG